MGCPPAPVYKGARGGGGRPRGGGAPKGGVLLPPGVPLFLVGVGGGKEGKERERKERGRPPSLSNLD